MFFFRLNWLGIFYIFWLQIIIVSTEHTPVVKSDVANNIFSITYFICLYLLSSCCIIIYSTAPKRAFWQLRSAIKHYKVKAMYNLLLEWKGNFCNSGKYERRHCWLVKKAVILENKIKRKVIFKYKKTLVVRAESILLVKKKKPYTFFVQQ